MDHEILLWLKSDQEYLTGLALFDCYGHSPKIGRILRIGGATGKNRLTLSYELDKIAKHIAGSEKTRALEKPQIKQAVSKTSQQGPHDATNIEKLRSEQKMVYKMLDNLHAILPYREILERKDIAFQILDLDDRLIELKLRIEHFEKNGVMLPDPVKEKAKSVSDLDIAGLIQRQMNVRTYITRYKRLVADSKSLKSLSRNRELLEKFQLELDDINKRLGK